MTVGVVDAARLFSSWISLNNGVREGALYATNNLKFTHWCMDPSTAPAGSIACPTVATSRNWYPDPDNIAYRLKVEATGLDSSRITLLAPTCVTSLGGTVPCTDITAANVTIGASYRMDLIMPVVGSLMGNPLLMSAAPTAPIMP